MTAEEIRAAQLRKVRMSECRDCGMPIRFVRLDTGRLIPVDPREHSAGNVAAQFYGSDLSGFVMSKDHRPGPLTPYRFIPHAATCSERQPSKPAQPATPDDPALF